LEANKAALIKSGGIKESRVIEKVWMNVIIPSINIINIDFKSYGKVGECIKRRRAITT